MARPEPSPPLVRRTWKPRAAIRHIPSLTDAATRLAPRSELNELLGLKRLKEEPKAQEELRFWRKFREIRRLPEKDQRAIARMVSSLVAGRANGGR